MECGLKRLMNPSSIKHFKIGTGAEFSPRMCLCNVLSKVDRMAFDGLQWPSVKVFFINIQDEALDLEMNRFSTSSVREGFGSGSKARTRPEIWACTT